MAMGGPIVIPAAIVVARSLFLPEPHTHKRAALSVETTMDLFTIKAVFSTPCDVLVWPGGPGGRSQKAEEGRNHYSSHWFWAIFSGLGDLWSLCKGR